MPTKKKTAATLKVPTRLDGSDLVSLHRATELHPALATIPAWREAVEALTHLHSIRPPHKRWGTLDEHMASYVENLADKRETFDADAATEFGLKAHAHVTVQESTQAAFNMAALRYVREMDEAVRTDGQMLFDYLTEQTRAIVDEARKDPAAFDLDAESAIAADQVDNWRKAQRLTASLDKVRAAYGSLRNRLGWNPTTQGAAELRWIANPADLFPQWVAWTRYGHLTDEKGRRIPLTPPWPQGDDRGEWLAYLARTPEAQPWTPSADELDAAMHRATEGEPTTIDKGNVVRSSSGRKAVIRGGQYVPVIQ